MDRVSAARARLWDLKRELAASDLFCVDCQYLRGSDCHHPAVQSHSVDPVTGSVTSQPTSARIARSDNGGCGPEAALFAAHPQPLVAAKAAWGGIMNAVALLVAAIVLVAVMAQLLA